MSIALYIVAILWIVIGVLILLYTEGTMKILKKLFFCRKSKGAIYCTDFFGIVLVIGAFVCTQVFFLSFYFG